MWSENSKLIYWEDFITVVLEDGTEFKVKELSDNMNSVVVDKKRILEIGVYEPRNGYAAEQSRCIERYSLNNISRISREVLDAIFLDFDNKLNKYPDTCNNIIIGKHRFKNSKQDIINGVFDKLEEIKW